MRFQKLLYVLLFFDCIFSVIDTEYKPTKVEYYVEDKIVDQPGVYELTLSQREQQSVIQTDMPERMVLSTMYSVDEKITGIYRLNS